jgi:aspartyl-tRNA(Asn)/glutamyl-tRNA(Gln) amidotransferase subunit C
MNSGEHFDVRPIAHLARLQLSESELAEFSVQLDHILGYVAKLDALDVSGVTPMSHPNPVFDVMREDESRPGLGAETAVMNAPRPMQNQFGVPKVVE